MLDGWLPEDADVWGRDGNQISSPAFTCYGGWCSESSVRPQITIMLARILNEHAHKRAPTFIGFDVQIGVERMVQVTGVSQGPVVVHRASFAHSDRALRCQRGGGRVDSGLVSHSDKFSNICACLIWSEIGNPFLSWDGAHRQAVHCQH